MGLAKFALSIVVASLALAGPASATCDGVESRVAGKSRCLKIKETFRDCPACPEMVVVPAGSFMIGSPESEEDRQQSEEPQFRVTIARPLAFGRFEITLGQYKAFARATKRKAEECWAYDKREKAPTYTYLKPGFAQADSHPVLCIDKADAVAYAQWLSQRTGATYRLPTEAEWEYAARAGSTGRYHFGDDEKQLCAYENVGDQSWRQGYSGPFKDPQRPFAACRDGYVHTAPAGRFKPNAFGLHDMLGNVSEWVDGCWYSNLQTIPADGSATPKDDVEKDFECTLPIRGGNWLFAPRWVRAAARHTNRRAPDILTGFRLVREIVPAK